MFKRKALETSRIDITSIFTETTDLKDEPDLHLETQTLQLFISSHQLEFTTERQKKVNYQTFAQSSEKR